MSEMRKKNENIDKHNNQFLDGKQSIAKFFRNQYESRFKEIKRIPSNRSNKKSNAKKSTIIELKQLNQSSIQIKLQSKQCNVCLNQKSQNQFMPFSKVCGHNSCCKVCFNEYSKTKIKQNKKIPCPMFKCNLQLDEQSIGLNILNPQLRQQYIKILKKLEEIHFMDCKVKYCDAKIDTRLTFIDETQNKHLVFCPKCEIVICFACRHFWDQCTCKSDEKIRQKLKKSYKLSQCPKCKIMVEKVQGCQHITCLFCKQDFCHQCNATWPRETIHICPNLRVNPPPHYYNARGRINQQRNIHLNCGNSVIQSIIDCCSSCRQKLSTFPCLINCLGRSLLYFLCVLVVVLIFTFQIFIYPFIHFFVVGPYQQICQLCRQEPYDFLGRKFRVICCLILLPLNIVMFTIESICRTINLYRNNRFKFNQFYDSIRF